jgi:hypothetical protein
MKLTPSMVKKRRAIARDVLAQIADGRFAPVTGTYVIHPALDGGAVGDLQAIIKRQITKRKPCRVCALGAAFVSAVGLFNNCSLKRGDFINGSSKMRGKLAEFFTRSELGAIEASFERSAGHIKDAASRKAWDAAVVYHTFLAETSREDRLIFLMQAVDALADGRITLRGLISEALIQLGTDKRFAEVRRKLGW